MGRSRWSAFSLAVAIAAIVASACGGSTPMLTRLIDARRLAADLHVNFTKAAEASSRAVMASSDDASGAAADEAKQARGDAERSLGELQPVLESLGYQADLKHLAGFKTHFDEYRRIDDEILTLAVENSNAGNVRSLALSLGRKRTVTAECEDQLQALDQAIAAHQFSATR